MEGEDGGRKEEVIGEGVEGGGVWLEGWRDG